MTDWTCLITALAPDAAYFAWCGSASVKQIDAAMRALEHACEREVRRLVVDLRFTTSAPAGAPADPVTCPQTVLLLDPPAAHGSAFVSHFRSRLASNGRIATGNLIDVSAIMPELAAVLRLARVRWQAAVTAQPAPQTSSARSRLTPREREIVDLVCLGFRNTDIAAALGLSRNTVRNRIADLFERFDLASRAELVFRFGRHGEPRASQV